MTSSSADDAGRTLAEVLEVCRATISPALIDAPHLATLSDTCRRLPKQFSAFWGIEVALGDPRGQADLLVELKRDSLRHSMLAGQAASPLDELCAREPAWAELRRFAAAWAQRNDPRRELVRNLWMEFDLIAAALSVPPVDPLAQPSVFWGPEGLDRDGWPRFMALAAYVGEHFAPFPAALPLDGLERAVRYLPAGARVFQLGAMQLRGAVMLRLCINNLPPADVPPWLQAQGWAGDVAGLARALATLEPLVRAVAIDVDYTADGIGPKIGIECYLHWADRGTAQWQPLLDHIAALGLCLEAKRDAITAFPAATEYSIGQQWANAEDGHMFPVVFRNIHHVKLSFIDQGFREAKAYLGVTRPGVKIGFPLRPVPEGEADEWLAS